MTMKFAFRKKKKIIDYYSEYRKIRYDNGRTDEHILHGWISFKTNKLYRTYMELEIAEKYA